MARANGGPRLSGHSVPEKTAYGIDGWPFHAPADGARRPSRLPDGKPWPRLRVLTVATDPSSLTLASVAKQDYPEHRHDIVVPGTEVNALSALLADPLTDAFLILPDGDLLAPGALTALALDLALSGVTAVAGLRVLFSDRVTGLDAPSLIGGETGSEAVGGEVLWGRLAVARILGSRLFEPAQFWADLTAHEKHRIGRPVLFHAGQPADRGEGLSIVSLTGTGTVGGAGVAHRRLSEALALSGHRIAQVVLNRSPATAEWTNKFPGPRRKSTPLPRISC